MPDSAPGAGRRLALLVMAAAILWHVVSVFAPPRAPAAANEGRDFATFYYAARVAAEGGDPYDDDAVDLAAATDHTRTHRVQPYTHPPAFLWLVSGSRALPLKTASFGWVALQELALIVAAIALTRWWRPLGGAVLPVFAVVSALMYAVDTGFELGRAELPVLALTLVGLWQEERHAAVGGAMVGVAAAVGTIPALLVPWFLLRRRWTTAVAAVAAAVASTVLTLPLLGLPEQQRFYVDVLPRLIADDPAGLRTAIERFSNHSIPDVLRQLLPSGGSRLSDGARALWAFATVGLLGGLAFAFRKPATDPLASAAQASAVLVATLLVPACTNEHHLVFALPAMTLALLAVARGWLGRGWAPVVGVAVAALLYDQVAVQQLAVRVVTPSNPVPWYALQELKLVALVAIGLAVARLGAGAAPDEVRAR